MFLFSLYFYIIYYIFIRSWKIGKFLNLETIMKIAYLNRVLCLSRCGAPVIIREFMKLTQDYAGLMGWFSLLINVNAKATGVVNINKRVRERIPPLYSPKLVIKFAETRFNLYIYIYISRKRTLLPTFVIIVPIKIKIDLICIKSRKSFQILVRLDPIDVPNNRTKFRIFWKKENKNRKTAVWKKSRIRAIESESKASHLLIRIANGDSLFPLTAGIGNSVSAKEHPFNPSIGARLTCCANPRERGRIHEARVS